MVHEDTPPTATSDHDGFGATLLGDVTMRGYGTSRPPDPGDDAPLLDQVEYLRQVVTIQDAGITASRRHAEALVDEATKQLRHRIDEAAQQLTETGRRLRVVEEGIIGRDGKGLRWAAVRLGMKLVGVLLTIARVPW